MSGNPQYDTDICRHKLIFNCNVPCLRLYEIVASSPSSGCYGERSITRSHRNVLGFINQLIFIRSHTTAVVMKRLYVRVLLNMQFSIYKAQVWITTLEVLVVLFLIFVQIMKRLIIIFLFSIFLSFCLLSSRSLSPCLSVSRAGGL